MLANTNNETKNAVPSDDCCGKTEIPSTVGGINVMIPATTPVRIGDSTRRTD